MRYLLALCIFMSLSFLFCCRGGSISLIRSMMYWRPCKHCFSKLTWKSLSSIQLKDWWPHKGFSIFFISESNFVKIMLREKTRYLKIAVPTNREQYNHCGRKEIKIIFQYFCCYCDILLIAILLMPFLFNNFNQRGKRRENFLVLVYSYTFYSRLI